MYGTQGDFGDSPEGYVAEEGSALLPGEGVLGHPFPVFTSGSSWSCAALPRRVAVRLDEFVVDSGTVFFVGFVMAWLGEGGCGEQRTETLRGFRFGGHTDSSVDNSQGGADVVVTERFLDGLDVAGEHDGGLVLRSLACGSRGGGVLPEFHA